MRKMLLVSGAIVILVIAQAPTVGASGGGGCGSEISEGAGTDVAISGYCFEPTVLYAAPGDEITWTNQDPIRHDVLGSAAAWGSFGALRRAATASHSFQRPGVYPYVCTWHPGMSGAIVVGDGGLERLDIAPVARSLAGGQQFAAGDGAEEVGTVVMVAGVLLALLLVAGALFRRKSRGA